MSLTAALAMELDSFDAFAREQEQAGSDMVQLEADQARTIKAKINVLKDLDYTTAAKLTKSLNGARWSVGSKRELSQAINARLKSLAAGTHATRVPQDCPFELFLNRMDAHRG